MRSRYQRGCLQRTKRVFSPDGLVGCDDGSASRRIVRFEVE
jgi:hypothetical protein